MLSFKQYLAEMQEIDFDLIKKAIDHFGITHNPQEAGYIFRNGIMLDFSGRHYASGYKKVYRDIYRGGEWVKSKYPTWQATGKWGDEFYGMRYVDHRELPASEWGLKSDDSSGSISMFDFMKKTGAIRFMPESGGMDTATVPSPIQIRKVINAQREYHRGEPLYIDYTDPDTLEHTSLQLDRPNMAKIEAFFKQFDKNDEVHVSSYTKKDGTEVKEYDRSRPRKK